MPSLVMLPSQKSVLNDLTVARSAASYWTERGLTALFDTSVGIELVTGTRATVDTSKKQTGTLGPAAYFESATYQKYPSRSNFSLTGAFTLICLVEPLSYTNYSFIIGKQTSPTQNVEYDFRLGLAITSSSPTMVRAGSTNGQYNQYTMSQSLPANFKGIIAYGTASGRTTEANQYIWYGTRIPGSLAPQGAYFDVPSGADPNSEVYIGKRVDGTPYFHGYIYYVALFRRMLTPGELHEVYDNPYCLFSPKHSFGVSPLNIGSSGYTLNIDPSSYVLSGSDSGILVSRKFILDLASYTYTPSNPTINKNYLLVASPDAYNISGSSADLLKSSLLNITSGSYSITGSNVSLLKNSLLVANSASYNISGQNASLLKTSLLSVDSGSYSITGSNVDFVLGGAFSLDPAGYTITGFNASLIYTRILPITPATLTISEQPVSLLNNKLLQITPSSYSISASNNSMIATRNMSIATSSYSLSGNSAQLLAIRKLIADSGVYNTTGNDVTFIYTPVGGSIVYPSASDVRSGLTYGPGLSMTGTFKFNTSYDIETQKMVSPTVTCVVIGTYGVIGTLPDPIDVREGVQYGVDGTQFTGTAKGFMNIDTSTSRIIRPITNKHVITL